MERHSAFQTVTEARSRAFRKVIDHDDSRVPPSDEQTRAAMTGSSPRGRAFKCSALGPDAPGFNPPATQRYHQRAIKQGIPADLVPAAIESSWAVALTECAADIELLIRGRPMRRSFVVWTNVQTFSSIVPMHRDTRRAGRSDR